MPSTKQKTKGGDRVEDSIVKKINAIKAKKEAASKPLKEEACGNNTSMSSKKKMKKGPKDVQKSNNNLALSGGQSAQTSTTLMLNDVIDLGGTQEDFDMLQKVSDNEEELEPNDADGTFNVAELITFMKSNGLKTVKKEKKKAKKFLEKSNADEEKKETVKSCPFAPSNPPAHEQLIFKANEPWFTNIQIHKASEPFSGVEKWKLYAEQLWQHEISLSTQFRDKFESSDQQWMKTVFSGGTINDKVSAHCLLLQESPIHHIKSLEALLAMGKKKSKRLAIQAINTLKEMFLSAVLPDDRKLFTFQQHDFSVLTGDKVKLTVLGWLVEDKLKACYSEYIDIIKSHLNDNEVAIRTKLCNLVYQLLNEKPEKEQELLVILVNKIGDPDNKLASKIIYVMGQLLQNHPSMKRVVASEVERVLFRPNISEKAQYYSICFLNQLQLSTEDSAFAAHLIQIYFKFFRESIDNKNIDSRMLGGLLTGVNRSYPYTANQDGITDENIDTLFKLVYVGNFNVSVQALMLLYQVSGSKSDICNRYYQALYSKLLDPSISTSSKKTFLLNLIYKSLKRDTVLARKLAIARRLLQVCNLDEPVLACASLYTISEANKNSNTEPKDTSGKVDKATSSESEKSKNSVDQNQTSKKSDFYNCSVRNPLYSNADQQDVWEFNLLSKNYHPSVNEFVSSLLNNGDISYNGDPFNDFTRMKFLDKFVFRNPKKGVKAANKKFYTRNKVDSSQPQVYSSKFREQKASKVHADEQFFYVYFKVKKTEKPADQDDAEDQSGKDEPLSLDFADDIKVSSFTKTEKKRKATKKEEEEGDTDDDASDSGSEFSYGEMDDEEDGTDQLNDKAYEKFLWENLNSDGESIQGSDDDEDDAEPDDEGGWEDIAVADSDDDDEDEGGRAVARDTEFMDPDQLDNIILKHSEKKRKRKNKSNSEQDSISDLSSKKKKGGKPKKKKIKKAVKAD